MLLNHARLPARFDADGRIVTLDRQDRGLWDTREIAEGVRVLQSALARASARAATRSRPRSPRCTTTRRAPQETDWPQILAWYDDLVALTDDPVRRTPPRCSAARSPSATSLGAAAGLRETERLRELLGERHQWHAVRGYLHELGGDLPAAADGLRRGRQTRHERRRARPPRSARPRAHGSRGR